jgi:hypothetical protein
MANAKEITERARMFEEKAEKATDPISRQHYRENGCPLSVAVSRTSGSAPFGRGTHGKSIPSLALRA